MSSRKLDSPILPQHIPFSKSPIPSPDADFDDASSKRQATR